MNVKIVPLVLFFFIFFIFVTNNSDSSSLYNCFHKNDFMNQNDFVQIINPFREKLFD
jgi:hypothetical protein